jgi:hypothetical protein
MPWRQAEIAWPAGCRPHGLQRADYDVTARVVEKAIGRDLAVERCVELRQEQRLGLSR